MYFHLCDFVEQYSQESDNAVQSYRGRLIGYTGKGLSIAVGLIVASAIVSLEKTSLTEY